jgi:hypothetical protein
MVSVGGMDIKWMINGKKWKRYGKQQIFGGISTSRVDLWITPICPMQNEIQTPRTGMQPVFPRSRNA